ncbi:hypothetical protein UCMB321_5774 [Pseudomonas batumici]|uniref:Uncharacterized protein n=1 Tax=Pseudomonas batumici TaxID=226910 RepID=A0A0C2E3V6_9PSED|nr:hypothetical protein UCMB321_5774 [Pseudomonas batumici]
MVVRGMTGRDRHECSPQSVLKRTLPDLRAGSLGGCRASHSGE